MDTFALKPQFRFLFDEQYFAAGRGANIFLGAVVTFGLGVLWSFATSCISKSRNFDVFGRICFIVGGTGFALIYWDIGLTILSISTTELGKPLLEPKSSGEGNIFPELGVDFILF